MSDSVNFIRGLELPDPPVLLGQVQPFDQFNDKAQAIAVGGQMTEFTASVPADLRGGVSNALLLAQLAADKATGGAGAGARQWFTNFNQTLSKIGWQLTGGEFGGQELAQDNLAVHQAIIPVLTAALGGAAVAGATLVVKVLESLQDMDRDAPWIALFDRRSQSARGARFAINYADGGDGQGVGLTSVYFSVSATQTVTQVLFFRFTSAHAQMETAKSQAQISTETIRQTEDALRSKVGPFLVDNIKAIPI